MFKCLKAMAEWSLVGTERAVSEAEKKDRERVNRWAAKRGRRVATALTELCDQLDETAADDEDAVKTTS